MNPAPVEKLNAYLVPRDISPVRHTLKVPWRKLLNAQNDMMFERDMKYFMPV